MNQWKNISAVVALSLTTALAGTGCVATEDATDEPEVMMVDEQNDGAADQASVEETGAAAEAWHVHFPFPRFLPFFGFIPFPCGC